jgi:hypothetical protein
MGVGGRDQDERKVAASGLQVAGLLQPGEGDLGPHPSHQWAAGVAHLLQGRHLEVGKGGLQPQTGCCLPGGQGQLPRRGEGAHLEESRHRVLGPGRRVLGAGC